MAQRKVRMKDLKKQRWAAVVAAVLAFGMIASVAGIYIGQTMGGGRALLPDGEADPGPEDFLAFYEREVELREQYLEEHGPDPIILQELAENYRYLSLIQQAYFQDFEAVEEYRERMRAIYQDLVDLEPAEPLYRLELVNFYWEEQKDEQLITDEIAVIRDLLRDDPDPMVHLSLIGLLESMGREELYREEADWLSRHLEDRVARGLADNEERFYYALLLGEFLQDRQAAEALLEEILEEESEDSVIYREALSYLDYLSAQNDLDEEISVD